MYTGSRAWFPAPTRLHYAASEVPTLGEIPQSFAIVVAVALGLAFGSFSNVVIHRWPRGESVAFPASRCPHCGTPIKGYDNVPVLGWLLLRGRARCCKAPISVRYPLVEAMGGLLGWAVVQQVVYDLPDTTSFGRVVASFAVHLALGLGLVIAALIDLDHMLLPDEITLGGTVLGLASVPLRPDLGWREALFGAVVGFVGVWLPFDFLYSKLRGRPGMGLGDAKLVMLAGAWFGWQGAAYTLCAGAMQGTVGAIALLAARGKIDEPDAVREEREARHAALATAEGEERAALLREIEADPLAAPPEPGFAAARLPFGPFLVLALLEYLLLGRAIDEGFTTWLGA